MWSTLKPMPVNSTHLEYDVALPAWLRARDVIAGEYAVKLASSLEASKLSRSSRTHSTTRIHRSNIRLRVRLQYLKPRVLANLIEVGSRKMTESRTRWGKRHCLGPNNICLYLRGNQPREHG